jgi:hypothetical protein
LADQREMLKDFMEKVGDTSSFCLVPGELYWTKGGILIVCCLLWFIHLLIYFLLVFVVNMFVLASYTTFIFAVMMIDSLHDFSFAFDADYIIH